MFPEKASAREQGSSGFVEMGRRLRSCRRCCRLGKGLSQQLIKVSEGGGPLGYGQIRC